MDTGIKRLKLLVADVIDDLAAIDQQVGDLAAALVALRLTLAEMGPDFEERYAKPGLYRASRDTFIATLPVPQGTDFLDSFRVMGCYLVDLCGTRVDRLTREGRRRVCVAGEPRLSHTLKQLRPKMVIAVVRSITANVRRSQRLANWRGRHLELPYPGRWQHHRVAFEQALAPVLYEELVGLFGRLRSDCGLL